MSFDRSHKSSMIAKSVMYIGQIGIHTVNHYRAVCKIFCCYHKCHKYVILVALRLASSYMYMYGMFITYLMNSYGWI